MFYVMNVTSYFTKKCSFMHFYFFKLPQTRSGKLNCWSGKIKGIFCVVVGDNPDEENSSLVYTKTFYGKSRALFTL